MRKKYTEAKLRAEFNAEVRERQAHRDRFTRYYVEESCNFMKEASFGACRIMTLALEHLKRCEEECNEPRPKGRTLDAIELEIREFISERDHIPGVDFERDPRGNTVNVYFRRRMQGRKPLENESDRFGVPAEAPLNWRADFLPFIGTEYEADA